MGQPIRGLIHQNRQAVERLDIQLVEGDLCDPESLCRAFQDADIVYHLAASISLDSDNWAEMEAVNVQGTRNVVQACLACGVGRLVHFSSIHALKQEPFDTPVDETRSRVSSPKHPSYDRSKAAGEREVRKGIEAGLDAVIINPTGIVGPHDFKPSYFGKAIIALARGDIPALVRGGFDWVDVRDVVSGTIQAAQHAPTGASYLLSGHWYSIVEIANMVATLTGARVPRIIVPMGLAYIGLPIISTLARINGKEPLYTRFSLQSLKSNQRIDHGRASRKLGYQPRPFSETLSDTIDWFTTNGYLS